MSDWPMGDAEPGTNQDRAVVADGLPCPYLVARRGYRMARTSREHLCDARGSGMPVGAAAQADTCLVARHVECDTYREAQALRWRRREATGAYRREIVTTAPTLVSGPHLADAIRPGERTQHLRAVAGAHMARRVVAAGALAALAMLAALQLAPRSTPGLAAASSTTTATATLLATPSDVVPPTTRTAVPATQTATAAPPQTASPVASSPAPPATPAATPSPTSTRTASSNPTPRTYVVKDGDTLSTIAESFGTTAAKIAQANGLTLDSVIYPNQKLVIP